MIIAGTICDKCNSSCAIREENEFGEIICDDCEQNAAEGRMGARFARPSIDGGDTSFLSIRDRQEVARRLK